MASPLQNFMNVSSTYVLQSLSETGLTTAATVALTSIDPVTAGVFAASKFLSGIAINYGCDKLFENDGANAASKTVSFIFKNVLPLLIGIGISMAFGLTFLPFELFILSAATVAASVATKVAAAAWNIVSIGAEEYFRP